MDDRLFYCTNGERFLLVLGQSINDASEFLSNVVSVPDSLDGHEQIYEGYKAEPDV